MTHIHGLVQERRNSIANALELCLSWINPLTYTFVNFMNIGCNIDLLPESHQAIIYTNADLFILEQAAVTFKSKYISFLWTKCIWKCCLWNVNHFVSGPLS